MADQLQTTNLGVASFLLQLGWMLKDAVMDDRYRYTFTFLPSEQRKWESDIGAYASRDLFRYDREVRTLREIAQSNPQYRDAERGQVIASDLGLAAWMIVNDVKLVVACKPNRGAYRFIFDDPGGSLWKRLAINYTNSECTGFDACMRALKRLVNL